MNSSLSVMGSSLNAMKEEMEETFTKISNYWKFSIFGLLEQGFTKVMMMLVSGSVFLFLLVVAVRRFHSMRFFFAPFSRRPDRSRVAERRRHANFDKEQPRARDAERAVNRFDGVEDLMYHQIG